MKIDLFLLHTVDSTTPHFVLPENSSLGLRDQICEMVSSAITAQTLSPDRRLPSCRDLAEQLGVSRNTVFSAYNQLVELGLLVARDRSGYYVNPIAVSSAGIAESQNEDIFHVSLMSDQAGRHMLIIYHISRQSNLRLNRCEKTVKCDIILSS